MLDILALVGAMLAVAQNSEQSNPSPWAGAIPKGMVRAKPILPVDWVTARDFPSEAPGTNLNVYVRLDVDTAGKVSACTIVKSSGSPFHDQKTCDLVKARGRYEVARAADGKAIPSVSLLRFQIAG